VGRPRIAVAITPCKPQCQTTPRASPAPLRRFLLMRTTNNMNLVGRWSPWGVARRCARFCDMPSFTSVGVAHRRSPRNLEP
jgi:hypothetical protein